MSIRISHAKHLILSLGFILILAVSSGCMVKEALTAASGALAAKTADVSATLQTIPTPSAEQKRLLIDFAGKTPESVLTDFEENQGKYQDFKVPAPDTTADAGFTDRDYLLQGLSAGMGGTWDYLFYHSAENTANFEEVSKFAILRYFYFKHLYEAVVSGDMSVEQASREEDAALAFMNSNTLDIIADAAKQVDRGATFSELRKSHPEWFTGTEASSEKAK